VSCVFDKHARTPEPPIARDMRVGMVKGNLGKEKRKEMSVLLVKQVHTPPCVRLLEPNWWLCSNRDTLNAPASES
jgi:hypothetical protein